MDPVLDLVCKFCQKPRPVSSEGACKLCEWMLETLRERYKNKLDDPGPKPRGRRPHCPSCRKTCILDIDDFSGKWNFYCPGPCIDFCWSCSVYYPDDQFCPKCGCTQEQDRQKRIAN
jgi:hypothetical protein